MRTDSRSAFPKKPSEIWEMNAPVRAIGGRPVCEGMTSGCRPRSHGRGTHQFWLFSRGRYQEKLVEAQETLLRRAFRRLQRRQTSSERDCPSPFERAPTRMMGLFLLVPVGRRRDPRRRDPLFEDERVREGSTPDGHPVSRLGSPARSIL